MCGESTALRPGRRLFFPLSTPTSSKNQKLQKPKTPKTTSLQAAARAASAGADTPGGGLSPADLARIRAARAADKEGGASPSSSSSGAGIGSGFFGDVLAEAKLIEWPSLKQALGDTVLVVGIVLGSALLLFVVNTLLADLSKVIY